jgi:hypothetical protein
MATFKLDPKKAKRLEVPAGREAPQETFSLDPEKAQKVEGLSPDDFKESPSFIDSVRDVGRAASIPTKLLLQMVDKGPVATVDLVQDMASRGAKALEEAPTGKSLAQKWGISDDPVIETSLIPDALIPSEATLVGGAIESFIDPLSYLGFGAGTRVSKAASTFGGKQAGKALANWAKTIQKGVKEGLDPEAIGKQIFQEGDMVKLLDKPKQLYQELTGSSQVDTLVSETSRAFKSSKKSKGMIGEVSDNIFEVIDKVHKDNPTISKVFPEDIADNVLREITNDYSGRLSGKPMPDEFMGKVADIVEDIIKPGANSSMTLPELYQLRKNISKNLRTSEFFKTASDAQALAKEVSVKAFREIDDEIKRIISINPVEVKGVNISNPAEWYKVENTRLSNLLNLREILETPAVRQIKDADLPQFIFGAMPYIAAGAVGGVTSGLGAASGAVLGSLYPAAVQSSRYVMKRTPEFLAKQSKNMQKYGPQAGASIPQLIREVSFDDKGGPVREPQSIGPMVLDTKLPRSTEYLMSKPNLVKAKVLQSAGEEVALQVTEALKEADRGNPRIMQTLMPQLAQMYPEMFEYDEYNAFDGKIIDPAAQSLYRESLSQREDMDELQKTQVIQKFNKTYEVIK